MVHRAGCGRVLGRRAVPDVAVGPVQARGQGAHRL